MNTGMSYAAPGIAWHTLYHAALFETDRHKVSQRIAEAESAILLRIKESKNYLSPPQTTLKKMWFWTTHCTPYTHFEIVSIAKRLLLNHFSADDLPLRTSPWCGA